MDEPLVGEARLRRELEELRRENARLIKLLRMTDQEARPAQPMQTAFFDRAPGWVDAASAPEVKVEFFAALFGARRDVYAVRWENARTGRSGWMPAVAGGWRKDRRAGDQRYLPLTGEVITAHLTGTQHIGLYPMLAGRPSVLAGCRLRRSGGDAGRAGLSQGGPRDGCTGGAGGVPVGSRRARLGVLHRPGAGRHCQAGRNRSGSRGDRAARPDGPGLLRPAVPFPRRAADARGSAT